MDRSSHEADRYWNAYDKKHRVKVTIETSIDMEAFNQDQAEERVEEFIYDIFHEVDGEITNIEINE